MTEIEKRLSERMAPHPKTHEIGCWVGRDDLYYMFGAADALEDSDLSDWDEHDLRDELTALRAAIREAKDALHSGSRDKGLAILNKALP